MMDCEKGKPGPHRWIIEPPDPEIYSPTSPGECQVCHEIKEFKNSIEATNYQASNVALFASNGKDNQDEAPLRYAYREI